MTTIINPGNGDSSSAVGTVLIVVVLLVVVALFFIYGLPAIRNANNGGDNNGPTINVPDSIDVNVDNGGGEAQPQ